MLLDAFFRTLENEGLAVRVRDQMRVRVAFSARRDWSVPQVRGTLRVLLARDTDQRAVFDRCFDAFFHESLLVDRGPRFDTGQLVAMVQAAEADEARATEPAAPLPPPRRQPPSRTKAEPWWSRLWRRS
jgi:uncharacterized protein with von Willebrand factor type A (vWA) domain